MSALRDEVVDGRIQHDAQGVEVIHTRQASTRLPVVHRLWAGSAICMI